MNKKVIIIGCVALVLLCGIAVVGASALGILGGFALTQPATDVGEKFMIALKDGNYAAAYALCHPSLQQELGNPQNFRQMVERGRAQPSKWSFTSRNIEGDEGHLEGTVTMPAGEGKVVIDLLKVGNDWKIIAFDLRPN